MLNRIQLGMRRVVLSIIRSEIFANWAGWGNKRNEREVWGGSRKKQQGAIEVEDAKKVLLEIEVRGGKQKEAAGNYRSRKTRSRSCSKDSCRRGGEQKETSWKL